MYKGTDGSMNECENCGAALPAPDADGTRTCQFCKAVFTTPELAASGPPQVNIIIGAPGFTPSDSSIGADDFDPINAGAAKRGCGLFSWILLLSIFAVVAAPIYLQYRAGNLNFDFNKTKYRFGAAVVPLPGEPGRPLNYITTATSYDNGRTVVTVFKVNGADGKAAWKAGGVPDGVTDPRVALDRTNVYVAGKSTLLALRQSDGSVAWQAKLTDDFAGHDCADCLGVIGKSVIVKTKDGVIQTFDAASGKAQWKHDLSSTSGQVFQMSTQLVVLDERKEGSAKRVVSLAAFDPVTGAPGASMQPTCTDPARPSSVDELSTHDIVRHSTRAADSLILVYGSSPACWQSWDTVAGTMTSNLFLSSISPSSSSFSFVEADAGVLVANNSDLGFLWSSDGRFQQLAKSENVQFHASVINGSMLIAQAKNTRGTTKTSIQGYDLGTGTKTWELILGSATSIDNRDETSFSSSADGTYTAKVTDGRLALLLFTRSTNRINTLSLITANVNSGEVAPRVEFDARTVDSIPAFGPSAWSGGRALVRIGDDTVQVIDASKGQVESLFTGS